MAVSVTPIETFSPPEDSPPIPDRLREPMLIPYANNLPPFSPAFDGEMIDHNDVAVIAATMCTGLWSITCTQKCDDPSFACELAAFAPMEDVLCDELRAP